MDRFLRIFFALGILIITGTLGYSLIEGWGLLDSLYMSVITITTVGYKEVRALSTEGQIFTMAYLLVGIGVFLYEVVQLGELIVRGEFRDWMGRRMMDTKLRSLRNHFIVCGFGRMGRRLCEELQSRKLPFVVVEKDTVALAACESEGWPCILGDATEDKTLLDAGIEEARGLAVVISTDADNLYTILSARLLAPSIRLLSRASTEKDAEKLKRAGADQVINIHATGATKMAQLLANPNIGDFMEVVSAQGHGLDLAEVQVEAGSTYADKPLAQSDLRKRGIIVVAIRRASGAIELLPGGEDMPRGGDGLIALGRAEAIQDLIHGT